MDTRNTKNTKNKGFTLIELLVVIAIIGILASVVLASLNTARAKGADAAIKSNLHNMRAQAELYYDENNQSYGATAFALGDCPITTQTSNIFENQTIINALVGVVDKVGNVALTKCASDSSAWVMASQLKTGGDDTDTIADAFCIDSIGASKSYPYTAGQTIADAVDGGTLSCN